jgi:hypothetical protein
MLSREQIVEAIELLERSGFSLSFLSPHPCGHVSLFLTPEDAASYARGEINLPAKLAGLTSEEFALWVDSGGYMQCFAKTQAGHRCKNLVRGNQITDSQEWKRLNDARPYCAVHGG